MARKAGRRKRRTREHVIADLSVNFLERFILQAGYSAERVVHDYGVDVLMFTYNAHGEIENGHVKFQIKATDRLPAVRLRQIPWRVAMGDLAMWRTEPLPVVLIVFDAERDRGYWLHVQEYLQHTEVDESRGTFTLRIPVEHGLTGESVMAWRAMRDRELERWRARP